MSSTNKTTVMTVDLAVALAVPSPRKHETLTQGWFNVGKPSVTLAQH